MNAETQSALSGIYKDEKPVRMYYQALEEKNNYFQIPKSSEAFGKLWQEELDFIKKLQKLKVHILFFFNEDVEIVNWPILPESQGVELWYHVKLLILPKTQGIGKRTYEDYIIF